MPQYGSSSHSAVDPVGGAHYHQSKRGRNGKSKTQHRDRVLPRLRARAGGRLDGERRTEQGGRSYRVVQAGAERPWEVPHQDRRRVCRGPSPRARAHLLPCSRECRRQAMSDVTPPDDGSIMPQYGSSSHSAVDPVGGAHYHQSKRGRNGKSKTQHRDRVLPRLRARAEGRLDGGRRTEQGGRSYRVVQAGAERPWEVPHQDRRRVCRGPSPRARRPYIPRSPGHNEGYKRANRRVTAATGHPVDVLCPTGPSNCLNSTLTLRKSCCYSLLNFSRGRS